MSACRENHVSSKHFLFDNGLLGHGRRKENANANSMNVNIEQSVVVTRTWSLPQRQGGSRISSAM